MGIREVAKAAKVAEEAQQEAERKRRWHENAKAAEQIVLKLLGLTGKTIKALNTEPGQSTDWGTASIVKIDDEDGDLFFKVTIQRRTQRDWGSVYYGEAEYFLTLCEEDGQPIRIPRGDVNRQYTPWSSQDYKIKSLADLSQTLEKHDNARQESTGTK
jgi:hypothetical protein